MSIRNLVITALCFVGGCGAVPVSTVLGLGTVDPLQADPAGMALRLDLPEGVAIAETGSVLFLSAETATGEGLEGRYAIARDAADIWRVAPGDRARLRTDQATVRAWERTDPSGTTGQLTLALSPCLVGAGPAPDARLSAALELSPGAGFLPLLWNAELSELREMQDISAFPRCATEDADG